MDVEFWTSSLASASSSLVTDSPAPRLNQNQILAVLTEKRSFVASCPVAGGCGANGRALQRLESTHPLLVLVPPSVSLIFPPRPPSQCPVRSGYRRTRGAENRRLRVPFAFHPVLCSVSRRDQRSRPVDTAFHRLQTVTAVAFFLF